MAGAVLRAVGLAAPSATIASMLCAAIDIGSNTTRVLVAEPQDGQLRKVMEQRAYTRIDKALDAEGEIAPTKIDELAEVVATQVRLAEELGAEAIKIVATAAIREARNSEKWCTRSPRWRVSTSRSSRAGGGAALLHRRDQDARPPGRGQDRGRRRRRRLHRGILGTVDGGVE